MPLHEVRPRWERSDGEEHPAEAISQLAIAVRRATPDATSTPETVGVVHHIAYAVSREVFERAAAGLAAAGYPNTGRVDRGFMDSLYFRDPNGSLIELAVYKFTPPEGRSIGEVLAAAHRLRVQQGDGAITEKHLKEATAQLAR